MGPSSGCCADGTGNELPGFQSIKQIYAQALVQDIAECAGLQLPCTPKVLQASRLSWRQVDGKFHLVGSGTFGDVFLADFIRPGSKKSSPVAVKMIKKAKNPTGDITHILTEASVMQDFCGGNVGPAFRGLVMLERNEIYEELAIVSSFLGDHDTLEVSIRFSTFFY